MFFREKGLTSEPKHCIDCRRTNKERRAEREATRGNARMTEEQMSEALDAIQDEALKLARRADLTEEVEDGLKLIILLARHKYDARNEKEKQAGGER